MRKDSESIGLYHGYLNLFHSYLQGYYTRLNVQVRLSENDESSALLTEAVAALEQIMQFYQEFWEGKSVDLSKEVQASETVFVSALVSAAMYFFENAPQRIAELVVKPAKTMKMDELVELASYHIEQAYSREHFIKGLVKYGECFGLPEVADRWRQHLLSCQNEIRYANSYFSLLGAGGTSMGMVARRLQDDCVTLPGIVASKRVDLVHLESMRDPGFQLLENLFSPGEYEAWQDMGIQPLTAAYWKAFGFSAERAQNWMVAGFSEAGWAAGYYLRGIDSDDAATWATRGVDAQQALKLQEQGVDASQYVVS